MFCFSDTSYSFGKVGNTVEYTGPSPKENKIHLQIRVAQFWVQQVLQVTLPSVTCADKESCDGWCTAHFFSARMPAKTEMVLLLWQNSERGQAQGGLVLSLT